MLIVTGRANQVLIFFARKDSKTRAGHKMNPVLILNAEHNVRRKKPAHPA